MGKKLQGAALRAKKRQQAAVEELQEQQAAEVAAAAVVDVADSELFILDTDGAIVPHSERYPNGERKKGRRTLKVLTAKEKLQVERLLKTHTRQELVKMVNEGKELLDKTHVRTHGARADKTKKANYDLWAEDGEQGAAAATNTKPSLGSAPAGISPSHVGVARKQQRPKKKGASAVAVEVAAAGQSYRPDPTMHQKALRQAKLVEARRLQAEEYKNTPVSQGLSEDTKALLVGDTDSEDEESSNDESEEQEQSSSSLHKRFEKLTRAQRNKQKRLRVARAIQEKQRKRRKLENAVAEIPRYKKEMRNEAQQLEQRKATIRATKQASTRTKGSNVFQAASESNPIDAPTFPIGLTKEIQKATLRTIAPKGSLVTDRIMSLRDREMAAPVRGHTKIRKRKRRVAVKGKHNAGNEGSDFAVLG